MSDTRLEKVNERLYKQGSLEWEKRLEPLFVTLRNVRVSRALSIGRPETSSSRLENGLNKEGSMGGREGVHRNEPVEEEYYENFYWRLTGTGYIDRRWGVIKRVGLIREDGTLTGPGEEFDRVDVSLLSLPTNASDTDKREASGSLSYSDESFENRAEHSVTLTLLVPASLLEPFCHELISGRLHELSVGAYVDVFQSEATRYFVAEPGMQASFYIEEEHSSWAYLSSLDIHRDITKTRASDTDDVVDLGSEGGKEGESIAPLKHLLSTQAEALGLVNQRLAHIRTVVALVAIVLFLMLLLK